MAYFAIAHNWLIRPCEQKYFSLLRAEVLNTLHLTAVLYASL